MLVRGGVGHRVVQQMTEVVEFQSAVVLSGQTRHGDVGARVDSFVVQFGLVQLLRETLAELKAAGHFGYATFSVEYSLDVPSDEIQAAVRAARASLAWWASAVARARDTHYHLNFYTLRQLAPLRLSNAATATATHHGRARAARESGNGRRAVAWIALDLTRAWDERRRRRARRGGGRQRRPTSRRRAISHGWARRSTAPWRRCARAAARSRRRPTPSRWRAACS